MNNAVTIAAYVGAALAEIAGCFAFWAWLRLDKSALWLVPGMVSLAIFAWLLTLADVQAAGRAYAAYGGIYVAASVMWLWAVEGVGSGPLGFDRRLRGADRRRHHPVRAARRLNGTFRCRSAIRSERRACAVPRYGASRLLGMRVFSLYLAQTDPFSSP